MRLFIKLSLLLFFFSTTFFAQDLDSNYLLEWKKFYPSTALNLGMRSAVYHYEDFSNQKVMKWLDFNQQSLRKLSSENMAIDPIDARLLRVQAQSEVDKWKTLSVHTSSLRHYSRHLSNAIAPIFKADYLLNPEKSKLVCHRLTAMEKLAVAGQSNLIKITQNDLDKGVEDLSKTLEFLKNGLMEARKTNGLSIQCQGFDQKLSKAVQSIEDLRKFATSTLQKNVEHSTTVLGRPEYDRRLKLYTDSNLTASELAEMALQEITVVKGLMMEVSKKYISTTYPDRSPLKNDAENIVIALADMEKDAPLNSADYLKFWQQLADDAVTFIKEKDIATLPINETLRIQTAPESAGPAARIGWVASAPPFEPNPMTTLNLPSIPETLPEQEQIDFWASFNKPFNRMIVIHELFPGHYMQNKISRESPHPIRLLFPYGIYSEGWATFTEKVLLDAGWEAGNHLTLLAHLRKRLENANRSYTSVQVHCNDWNQDQVLKFSTETALLAPQFAKSLWGRIMRSPMQLTSYYLGGAQFTQLFETEKERLGDQFHLRLFMDTVMKAGPIPIDEFYGIFKNTTPN